MEYLTKNELEKSLEISDLSDKQNGVHPINLILSEIHKNIGGSIIRTSPIVTSDMNYDRLYYPKENVSRNSVYTRWIDENKLLRTHTTSGVIPILEQMENPIDETILLPGIVYRRDVIDKTHVGEPHQLDIWRVVRGRVGRKELLELVQKVIDSILPNTEWRYNETSHYYTKDGIEVEISINGEWLEILECGEILPQILDDCNLDSSVYSGLAMGIGLDRSVMIRKGIKDIRVLRSQDPRIMKQMNNLDPYKEVSKYQTMSRDLSICVPEDWDDEIIGDNIRKSSIDIDLIEDISIKNQWKYEELNENVIKKLSMKKGMKNVLLSINLSSVDEELSRDECNRIYNEIYTTLNKTDNVYEIK